MKESTLPIGKEFQEPAFLKKKTKYWLMIVFFFLLSVSLILSSFFFFRNNCPLKEVQVHPSTVADFNPEAVFPIDWKIYQNDEYGVSFEYPGNWEIMEINGMSDPLPLYSKSIYFLKKDDNQAYLPSLFSIRLYLNKEEEIDLSKNFKIFYEDKNKSIINEIEGASGNPDVSLEKINLGGQEATRYEDPFGMGGGDTFITWFSDKRALVIGSIGFNNLPSDQFEEIGFPPYGDNEIIGQIVSSFEIFPF